MRIDTRLISMIFRDGWSEQSGSFHESINLSAVWKLPVIWVCENNLYAHTMPVRLALNVPDIAMMAGSYGIPGKVVNGNDVLEVYSTAEDAVERARKGGGPTLIECKTYRQHGHYEGDTGRYRPEKEEQEWLRRDPIQSFESTILEKGIATRNLLETIHSEITELLANAVEFAEESPFPSPDEALNDVFVVPDI